MVTRKYLRTIVNDNDPGLLPLCAMRGTLSQIPSALVLGRYKIHTYNISMCPSPISHVNLALSHNFPTSQNMGFVSTSSAYCGSTIKSMKILFSVSYIGNTTYNFSKKSSAQQFCRIT